MLGYITKKNLSSQFESAHINIEKKTILQSAYKKKKTEKKVCPIVLTINLDLIRLAVQRLFTFFNSDRRKQSNRPITHLQGVYISQPCDLFHLLLLFGISKCVNVCTLSQYSPCHETANYSHTVHTHTSSHNGLECNYVPSSPLITAFICGHRARDSAEKRRDTGVNRSGRWRLVLRSH